MQQERYYAYMQRRMREEDEREGIKQVETNIQLQKRLDKLEEHVSIINEKLEKLIGV
jgi:tetrahydromethanopterin S-methyltransferase subunit G